MATQNQTSTRKSLPTIVIKTDPQDRVTKGTVPEYKSLLKEANAKRAKIEEVIDPDVMIKDMKDNLEIYKEQ